MDGSLISSSACSSQPSGGSLEIGSDGSEIERVRNPITGNEYAVIDESMSWTEARDYCESLGGHLVTIRDEDENAFVRRLVNKRGKKNLYWLGLAGYGEEYYWITGEPEEYRNWASKEPNSLSETVSGDSVGGLDVRSVGQSVKRDQRNGHGP